MLKANNHKGFRPKVESIKVRISEYIIVLTHNVFSEIILLLK